MNLLNHRMMFPNIEPEILDESINEKSIDSEIPEDTIDEVPNDDTVSNNKIDTRNPAQIDIEPKIPVEVIRSLDEIEQDIINDQDNGFDIMSECIMDLCRSMSNVSVMLESTTVNSHLSQYTLLNRSDYEDGMMTALYETTISSLWNTFIETLKAFITKAKEVIAKLTFSVANNFDLYGKYNETFLNKIVKSKLGGSHTMEVYKYNTSKLFSDTNFSRLHEFAATVIGNANTVEAMEQKLTAYDGNDWNEESIYNYIAGKCIGKKISGKSDVQSIIMDTMKSSTPVTVTFDDSTIKPITKDLAAMKSNVLRYANQSKSSILNPEFENILAELKKSVKNEKDDNIKYKYYKTRYTVFSVAQKVAFDIYNAKVRCMREYANQCVKIEREYLLNKDK